MGENGVAKKCAEKLSAELSQTNEVSLYDINEAPPAPNEFDVIILGGSIRFTKLNKKLKKYLVHPDILDNGATTVTEDID